MLSSFLALRMIGAGYFINILCRREAAEWSIIMKLIKNDIHTTEIIDITLDGQGIAKIDGITVFVPSTAKGDILNIKIVKVLKNYSFAIPLEIITPSKDRIKSDCSVYDKCGGCTFRHINYDAELNIKKKAVEDCFKRIGKIDINTNSIIGSKNINSYRNKAQYPIARNKFGVAYSGFYAKRSHRIIECYGCKLQPKIFNEILRETLNFINDNDISVYDEVKHKGLIRHLYLRQSDATKEIMLTLVATKSDFLQSENFSDYITKKFPEISTVIINHNPDKTNVILGDSCKTIFGSGYITDTICSVKVRISPLAFYQVNKPQAEKLYEKAMEYASLNEDDVLLDLYCGIGTIGLSKAVDVHTLIGVEVVKQAVKDAIYNAKLNEFINTEFICSDCTQAVQNLKDRKIKPDVIIVDPPRKGCDLEVIETIANLSPKRVVMVSCNPSTAARECALLEEKGYKVIEYTPFDLFPRTSHVETVCLLSKC